MVLSVTAMLTQLQHWFDRYDSVLVAYSGGVDSALTMAVAHRQLRERSLACIGVSPSYAQREQAQAVALAEDLGVPYRLIKTAEHLDANYAANPDNRCYFCKAELFRHLRRVADEEGWQVIVDGTNASDVGDDRPGMIAAREVGVRSPLLEKNVTKPQVRAIAQMLNLPVWDKPEMACLSSRVPHGTPITPALLRQIEEAEEVLVNLGFRQFRVRHHGDLARIELRPEDLPKACERRSTIVKALYRVGYCHVCLDLAGFRSSVPETDGIRLTVEGRS